MKLFKIIGLILVLSPVGQVFGVGQETLGRLRANDPSLTTLELGGNLIRSADAVALADALKINTSLTTLLLDWNQIGDEGAVALAEALEVNTSLEVLFLSCNQIGPAGAIKIADALRTNTSLTTLNLNTNQIGDEGAKKIADALRTNTSLTVLALSHNQIGDEGAIEIADALRTNTSLTKLWLSGDQIRDDLMREIKRLMSPDVLYHERRALVPWSRPRHLQLASWNPHVASVVTTILVLERRLGIHLPKEMWLKILEHLRCGDFGPPRALPAP